MLPQILLHAAISQVLLSYDATNGMFGFFPNDFWTTANTVETLANACSLNGGVFGCDQYASVIANTYNVISTNDWYFKDGFFDDQLWYALAWLRLYELTGSDNFLTTSEGIVSGLIETYSIWDNKSSSCGGGCWWNTQRQYKNSITNGLFGVATGKLSLYTQGGAGSFGGGTPEIVIMAFAGGRSYGNWSSMAYSWITNHTLTVDGLIIDGINGSCGQTGAYWTYNQGIFLRLAMHIASTGNSTSAMQTALTVLENSMSHFTLPSHDTLVEVSCGTSSCGHDGMLFKGVFIRSLGYTMPQLAAFNTTLARTVAAYILSNNATVVLKDSYQETASTTQYGEFWQGPFSAPNQWPYVPQAAALDLLTTAVNITDWL